MLNVTLVSCNVQRNFSRTCLNIVDLCLVSYRPCTKGSCTRLLQRELAESNLVLMQRCLESPLNPRRPLHSPHSPPSPHSPHSPHSPPSPPSPHSPPSPPSPHSPHSPKHSIHVTTSIPFSYCCVVKPKQAGQAGQAGRTTDLPSACK